MRNKQYAVEAMIVSRFVGSNNLLLQGYFQYFSIFDFQFTQYITINTNCKKVYLCVITYDAVYKSIQHLASIRNKCDHPKDEPKQHDVRELLDKIKKITFSGL